MLQHGLVPGTGLTISRKGTDADSEWRLQRRIGFWRLLIRASLSTVAWHQEVKREKIGVNISTLPSTCRRLQEQVLQIIHSTHEWSRILLLLFIDRFHSIFHHGNWRATVSCDVDINQSAGRKWWCNALVKRCYGSHLTGMTEHKNTV